MRQKPSLLLVILVLLAAASCHKGPPPVSSATPPRETPLSFKPGSGMGGLITDESGQPIPGASVFITGPALPGFQGAATNIDGIYNVPYLPVGRDYEVKVEAPGYNTVVRKGIEVPLGNGVALPFTMSQGKTEICVTARAPVIDMKQTSSSLTINSWPSGGGGGFSGGSSHRSRKASPAVPAPPAPATTAPNAPQATGALADGLVEADQVVIIAKDGPGPSSTAAPGEPPVTQGTLRAQKPDGQLLGDFPLRHTEVEAFVGGYLARTIVRQEYANPYKEVIEAVYVFPLGTTAAVNDFVMEVGGRKIVGIVRPREEAEQIYREARARGQTASLLTQERPNIFTQNVANIEPGGSVTVTITTFERLTYEKGAYEYVFPMVVGPRYIPGGPQAKSQSPEQSVGGSGWSPPTDVVPDADRVTPPVLKPGERSGHDIGLTVHLDAGIPITEVKSVAHAVDVEEDGPNRRTIKLSSADGIPNRDFVVRWQVDASKMQFGVLAHRSNEDGYFTLMVQPPLDPADADVSPREITFVLDVSGSMNGLPVETSKALVRNVLDRLRPEDVFNVFIFSGANGQLWESPRQGTPVNVTEAKRYLNDLRGAGGTEMLAGVSNALKAAHDPKFLQMYVFCTDGFVGDEERILGFIKKERGDARFFAFGIGNGVNRFLIEGIGEHGGGSSMVVMPRESGQAERAAEKFFEAIDSPVLVDGGIDWNGLPVEDAYPSKIGDLFVGGTVNVVGRYTRAASGTLYVTGRVGARDVRFPVTVVLPEKAPEHAELAPVWARFRIHDLSGEMLAANETRRSEIVKTITNLAVEFRLASQYTAFVAVDESRTVGDGRPLKIVQPVELTEGVNYATIFGENGVGAVSSLPAWGLRLQDTAGGKVRVGAVVPGSAAEAAGVEAGASIKAVNGTAVHDLVHLEGLLLQSPGATVRVTLDPGGDVALPMP